MNFAFFLFFEVKKKRWIFNFKIGKRRNVNYIFYCILYIVYIIITKIQNDVTQAFIYMAK